MLARPIALALSLTVMGCGGAATRAPIPVPVASVPVNDLSPLPTTDPNYDLGDVSEEPPYDDPLASPSPSDDPSASPSPSASPTATPSPSPSASPSPSPSPSPTANPLGNEVSDDIIGFTKAPVGVAINGPRLLVTDVDVDNYLAFKTEEGMVRVIDPAQRKEVASIIKSDGKDGWYGMPKKPTAVAEAGAITFISFNSGDAEPHLVRVGGSFQQIWLQTGSQVVDLEVINNFFYAADRGKGVITRLKADGTVDTLNFIQGLDPAGLARGTGNTLWVADAASKKAIQFDSSGTEIQRKDLNINTLGDLAVDPRNDDLYVVDAGNGVLKRYAATFTSTVGNVSDPQRMAIRDDGTIFLAQGEMGGKKVVTFLPGKLPN